MAYGVQYTVHAHAHTHTHMHTFCSSSEMIYVHFICIRFFPWAIWASWIIKTHVDTAAKQQNETNTVSCEWASIWVVGLICAAKCFQSVSAQKV